jgi:molecular chaperone GrpE
MDSQAHDEAHPAVADEERDQQAVVSAASEDGGQETAAEEEGLEEWRDRALRLQAEMENFRKRQRRLTDEMIAAERERLLRSFVLVADDLQRALRVWKTDVQSLRQGVELTYHTLMRLFEQEGVQPIAPLGQRFDPSWHEAVGTVPHETAEAKPDTVVEVVQEGYRLGDRLLRPARVVIAA